MQKEKENINIVNYKVSDLIFAEYNPRELTKDQHQDLKDSITRFGFVDPLIVNTHKERKNILVGGHQRLKIAKELSYSEVPCVEIELTPDKEKELNVRLNKNTGQWDWDSLANYFDNSELLEWGFKDEELQLFETEPDFEDLVDEEKEKPPQIKLTFKTFEDQENALIDIAELLKKYEGSFYSISGGEI